MEGESCYEEEELEVDILVLSNERHEWYSFSSFLAFSEMDSRINSIDCSLPIISVLIHQKSY